MHTGNFVGSNLNNKAMKQTAVEWLVDEMLKQGYFDANKQLTFTNLDHLQQQAKKIEKQQIIDAYIWGRFEEDKITRTEKFYARQYYKKTFQKKLAQEKNIL